jgi:hypothetical protein
VELALNLVWAVAMVGLVAMASWSARRGRIALSLTAAILLAIIIGFILLPVISVSDDLMAARQAALPLSGQTWRLASEGSASGLELLALGLCLAVLMGFLAEAHALVRDQWAVRPLAGRLARSQRLRPPPICEAI